MESFGPGWLLLMALGFAACATAQDTSVPADDMLGNAGSSTSMAGASGARNGNGAPGAFASAGATNHAGGAGSSAGGSGGSAGVAGIVSASGSAGASGNAGASGSGGSAGGAPVFMTGECAASATMSLSYLQGSKSQKQITGQYQFINTSDVPIPLGQLKIRYYFSNEETSGWTTSIYDAKLDGGTGGYRPISGTSLSVVPLGITLPGADTYTELAFASTLTIEKGATATISWDMQPHDYNPPDQVQTDDYSYNGADTAFAVWNHVVIYQGSTLVWGCSPATGSGSGGMGGGASGASGSGGLSAGAGGASAGSAGVSGGSAGASAGSGGASAGSAGVSAGSGGDAATAGTGGSTAGGAGLTAGAGGASAGSAGAGAGVAGVSGAM